MQSKNCPICSISSNYVLDHSFLEYKIHRCSSCNYSFVECSSLSNEKILLDQTKGSITFGKNPNRDKFYLDLIENCTRYFEITRLLEIGTPSTYNFLKQINFKHPSIKLFSHDVIKTELPSYISFIDSISKIEDNYFDILFCIHTLEHIRTDLLLDFVSSCKRISKYFVFEVPNCPSLERIAESSNKTPHYSFFTKDSILKLFGEKINLEIDGKVIRFSNLKK